MHNAPPRMTKPYCICGHSPSDHGNLVGDPECMVKDCPCWRYAVPTRPEIKFGIRPQMDDPYNEKEKFLIDAIWNGSGDRLAKDILAEADLKYPNQKTRFEP